MGRDEGKPTLLELLFGTNPESAEQIDAGELLKLGAVGLLLYGGYRVVKKLTAAEREG